jgi:transcription-repair coupling factor (superfamily II helicase)
MFSDIDWIKNLGGGFTAAEAHSRRILHSAAFGLAEGAKINVTASCPSFFCAVVPDGIAAEKTAEALRSYGRRAVVVPSKEEVLIYNKAYSQAATFGRLNALFDIVCGNAEGAVLTADGMAGLFPDAARLRAAVLAVDKGRAYDIGALLSSLVSAGYTREAQAESKGQFSLRGDILDIFPINHEYPARIDFFGDTAEEIKLYDPETGKSFQSLSGVLAAPATDVFLTREEAAEVCGRVRESSGRLKLSGDARRKADSVAADIAERLAGGSRDYSLGFVLPFTAGRKDFAQYLPRGAVVFLDDPKLLSDRIALLYTEHETRCGHLLEYGEILPESYNQFQPAEQLFSPFAGVSTVTFHALSSREELLPAGQEYRVRTTAAPKYNLNFGNLQTDIRNWLYGGYRVAVCCGPEGKRELKDSLLSLGTEVSFDPADLGKLPVALEAAVETGFVYHEGKFVLIGCLDVWPRSRGRSLRRRKKDVFLTPEIGDYIVHEVHGIGICEGIVNLKTGAAAKDYIVLTYRDGDKLYVPCDQVELIAKYAGSDTLPKLNKLGGKEFERVKARVKNHIREMAFDLKKLYAEREDRKGFAFSPDTPLQAEFENAFEYDETEDQLTSAAEIKKDMESGRVMDRLLCGDVGYGKTEVALRAVFKAVMDGKQAAFLAPTTILSRQHHALCEKRLGAFGVRVDVLNRFKTAAEQKETLERLKTGQIDVIVGTHRLFGKDVAFRDLGLLIVDEEQRFGVEDKERIKSINRKVDVLTLSATPIPRTLHMSLSGIRDISVLDTPPRERLPVQTYVLEYGEGLIQDAVSRELARGGQVFILYNRVEGIERFAYKVSRLAGNARVITAHGQMTEENLERAVDRFYTGEADVLICTTIIENGIDIPNCNTLIVYEADRLGLSQLYQLRGRVGRGNRLAHVYFTYVPEKVLTESAYKRLKAIMEFTEFGSGFKIAMRDLEIRGAGSVMGRQQHGHMENVGYDMYLRLLQASLEELGTAAPPEKKAECDVAADAYIPEKYVEEDGQRLALYRRIAGLAGEDEKYALLSELKDVYGEPPQPVKNLIDIAALRLLSGRLGAESVTIKPQGSRMAFKDMETLNSYRIMDALELYKDVCVLSVAEKPVILFKSRNAPAEKILRMMTDFAAEALTAV